MSLKACMLTCMVPRVSFGATPDFSAQEELLPLSVCDCDCEGISDTEAKLGTEAATSQMQMLSVAVQYNRN